MRLKIEVRGDKDGLPEAVDWAVLNPLMEKVVYVGIQ